MVPALSRSAIAPPTAAMVRLRASPFAVVGHSDFPRHQAAAARMAASEQPEAEMVEKGKALYAHYCSHCHGFDMVNVFGETR
jgi:mono/diheme cytochrome c family protein